MYFYPAMFVLSLSETPILWTVPRVPVCGTRTRSTCRCNAPVAMVAAGNRQQRSARNRL